MEITPIAHIRTVFPTKFGVPRQSGRAMSLEARIEFEAPYRDANAIRGLDGFSHLWLIWHFSLARQAGFSPTVRPPRLGGNERIGVFASRSPFRPNGLGLSHVRLDRIELGENGPVLYVSGADLVDGTPIMDIKPYISHDLVPDCRSGFVQTHPQTYLTVDFPAFLRQKLPAELLAGLMEVLREDPRPHYQADGKRYGFYFADYEVFFTVRGEVLTVQDIQPKT